MEVPDRLELDISGMTIGDTLRVADLVVPEGVTFSTTRRPCVATVTPPTKVEEPEIEEDEGLEGEEGVEGEAEGEEGAPRAEGETEGDGGERARRGLGPRAPLPSGRVGLDARPARRGARQPGPRVRPHAPQRRAHGRRRAGPPAQRVVSLQVLGRARGGAARRLARRAAEAADLHERVRAARSARRCGFFKLDRRSCSSSTTRSTSTSAACRPGWAEGWPATTGCARSRSTLGTPEFVRLRIGVGRPERGDPRPVADWVLSPFADEVDVEALVARAADAVETVVRDGLEEAQQRFNER